jgi:hypothetical protein
MFKLCQININSESKKTTLETKKVEVQPKVLWIKINPSLPAFDKSSPTRSAIYQRARRERLRRATYILIRATKHDRRSGLKGDQHTIGDLSLEKREQRARRTVALLTFHSNNIKT